MNEKTNLGLIEYCKVKAALPTIYMLGGFGRELSGPQRTGYHSVDYRIFIKKCAHTIRNELRIRAGIGRACFDCVGLIKGYLWELEPKRIAYKTINGVYFENSDNNVRGMYDRALKKGSYSTMPEIPGLLVMTADLGHVGVYIGRDANGKRRFIESTPSFGLWGVGYSDESIRTWTYWAEHYLIKYIIPVQPKPVGIGYYEIVRGDTLGRIATKNSTTIANLLELNPKRIIDPNVITEGHIIKVPAPIEEPEVIEVEKIVYVDKPVEVIVVKEVAKAYTKVYDDAELTLTVNVAPK